MIRKLPSWIEGFVEYTNGRSTQELFARWAAISTLAAALERKSWIKSQHRFVYPNMYIFLVGPPGAGKTYVIKSAHDIFDEALPSHFCGATTLSKQGLVDMFAEAHRVVFNPDMTFNALFVPSNELSTLIPEYEKEFISALTDFYDCNKYNEKLRNVRKGEQLIIDRPCLNLLAGTTPVYMSTTMPITAWDDGFLARVIIVYSEAVYEDNARPELSLLDEAQEDNVGLERDLISDLKMIGERAGRMEWLPTAAKAFSAWYQIRCPWPNGGLPTHPRLQHYCTRRYFHALKLCMISAIDLNHEHITVDDVERVRLWLYEVEQLMPGIFSAMEVGGDAAVIRDAYHFVQIEEARGGCPLSKLYKFLQMRIAAPYMGRLYQNMIEGNILKAYVGPDKLTYVRAVPGAFGTIRTLPKG